MVADWAEMTAFHSQTRRLEKAQRGRNASEETARTATEKVLKASNMGSNYFNFPTNIQQLRAHMGFCLNLRESHAPLPRTTALHAVLPTIWLCAP